MIPKELQKIKIYKAKVRGERVEIITIHRDWPFCQGFQ
jgi:hypothetical protein